MTIYLQLAEKYRWAGPQDYKLNSGKDINNKYAFIAKGSRYFEKAFSNEKLKFNTKFVEHHIMPVEAAKGASPQSKDIASMMSVLIKKGYFSVADGWNNLIWLPKGDEKSGLNDPRRMRANAQRVTCVVAALAEMTPAVGIYWSTAENVLDPKQFVAAAKATREDATPFDLWITTHVYPGPSFELNEEGIARSSGLHAFIGREVECGPYTGDAGKVVRTVAMVSNYILDRRAEFVGGETIGTPEEPIGTIQLGRIHVPGDTIPVYRIELDTRQGNG